MEITGRVYDETTGDYLPGATVEAWNGSIMLARTAANDTGYFKINTVTTPDALLISHASFIPGKFTDYLTRSTFPVVRSIVEGGGVFIKSIIPKRNGFLLVGILAVVLLLAKKKAFR